MAAADRSVSDLLQDILRNVQDIVRAEVRLAKTEVREETIKAKSSALWLGTGTVSGNPRLPAHRSGAGRVRRLA